MITLTISDESLQQAFESHLTKLLENGNYDNPVKKVMDGLLGYNGDKEIKAQLEAQIKAYILETMGSAQFHLALGQAMAAEIAKREVDKLKK